MIKVNGLKAWFLAARPKTLTGACAPVLIGGGLAMFFLRSHPGMVSTLPCPWIPFLIALLFAMVMQIEANFVNDYFDFKKGSDRDDRLGPERACQQGWITPRAMHRAIILMSVVAVAVGAPLIYFGGWEMLLVGLACILFCWLYTTHLSYIGLGDLLVIVFFGLVPVAFTFYVMTRQLTPEAWTYGLAMGLVTDCLLIVNNYRDIEQDRKSGKRTLIVMVGPRAGLQLYLWCGILAATIAAVNLLVASWVLIPYLILHILTFRSMTRKTGRELNQVLGATARNIFIFGLSIATYLFFA